jgi:vesicular inhibitory amino acid transporter
MLTAAVFIIGEMSGTGVLSLPKALMGSGYFGIALILGCCGKKSFNILNYSNDLEKIMLLTI